MNAYPQADQGIDWSGAQESLREGGTAIAIHHFTLGRAHLHYRGERMRSQWRRLQGYPGKRWPVKQADNVMVFSDKLSRSHILDYDDHVEWATSWDVIIDKLQTLHWKDAKVAVYPCGKIQFNPHDNPLVI